MIYGIIALYVFAGFILMYNMFKNEDLFTGKSVKFVLGEFIGLISLYFIWPFVVAYALLIKEDK